MRDNVEPNPVVSTDAGSEDMPSSPPTPSVPEVRASAETAATESLAAQTKSSAQEGAASAASAPEAASSVDTEQLREAIIQVLHTVYDPEIPVDIWELGLIYRLEVQDDGDVFIQMTLTSPMCPVAGSLPPEVQQKVASVPGVRNVRVDLTWEPPWHMGMMSDVARLKLGFM